jgi:hypothetical protein
MKRVLVASVAPMLLLAQFSDGFAAGGSGPFDGNWTGSATSTVEQCKSAKVTVTVEGTIVTGQAQFANDAPNINGTVREDATFGATIGWQPQGTWRFLRLSTDPIASCWNLDLDQAFRVSCRWHKFGVGFDEWSASHFRYGRNRYPVCS